MEMRQTSQQFDSNAPTISGGDSNSSQVVGNNARSVLKVIDLQQDSEVIRCDVICSS
jgi:hypothetical protein